MSVESSNSYKVNVIGHDGTRKKAANHVHAEEDEVLFGDRNVRIHQYLSERIEAALVEGVASLPLMGGTEDDSRDDKMLQKLRKAYVNKVDLLELHNSRNVFTVGKHTAHFRKRILEAFLAKQNGEDLLAQKLQEIMNARIKHDNTHSDCHSMLPGKEEIPSPEEVDNLEEELKALTSQLEQARKVRAQKLARCKVMEEAADFSKQAQETLARVPAVAKVTASVESMVGAKKEHVALKSQGSQLIQKMDDIKNGRDENQDKIDIPSPEHKKPRKLTLDEHYAEHRTILGESQPQDLFALRDMLKPKP